MSIFRPDLLLRYSAGLIPGRLSWFSAFTEHTPFAMWLVEAMRPALFVELGTRSGVSYCAFCQAAHVAGIPMKAAAIGMWAVGDHSAPSKDSDQSDPYSDLKAFHDKRYGHFSRLIPATFDDAVEQFADRSVDLLHMKGLGTYETISQDFKTWLPKMSPHGVVLFHNIRMRKDSCGIPRLWEELSRRWASFEFEHGHGLGVLAVGVEQSEALRWLTGALTAEETAAIRRYFSHLGAMIQALAAAQVENKTLDQLIQRERCDRQTHKSQYEQDIRRKEQAIVEIARDLKHGEDQRRALLASTSWQITSPLRTMGRRVAILRRRLIGVSVLATGIPLGRLSYSYSLQGPILERGGWLALSVDSPNGSADIPVGTYSLRCTLASGAAASLQLSKAPLVGRSRIVRIPDGATRVSIELHAREQIAAPDPLHVSLRQLGRVEALLMILSTDPRRAFHILKDAWAHGIIPAVSRITGACRPDLKSEYGEWVDRFDCIETDEASEIRHFVASLPRRPKFSIVVPVYETAKTDLVEMIASVRAQIYENWELCIADDASKRPHVRSILKAAARAEPRIKLIFRTENGNISAASNSALNLATGDFIALLDHDDLLAPHALAIMADAVNRFPDADIFYSDEDKLDAEGKRYDPYFKPDWNPELLYGQNFVSHLGVFRTSLVRKLGGFREGFEGSQDYDLVLRATAATKASVVHVPHVLYHWRLYPGAGTFSSTQMARAADAARRAIQEQLATLGVTATVGDAGCGYHRVLRSAPAVWPRVSVIIPTRDHADVLASCVDGLFEDTDYTGLEIIVVDNDSVEPQTKALFTELRDRGVVVLQSQGAFNYSKINNEAARISSGDFLLFLNNDISMLEANWLKEMVLQALAPDVGAVGAKLLYPDGTIQHGGVALGPLGVAAHVHVRSPGNTPGYFGRLLLAQDISCVTGACMLVRRTVFDSIAGFDQEHLAVAFNDVDLCIRIRGSGHRIIWTPLASLTHHESKSRGQDTVGDKLERFKREIAYMRERWGKVLDHDPFWNPNLSLESSDPQLSFPPRVSRPWLL